MENQSKHWSKLTLYHLKKRATKRSKRAREPSRIPLAFLRDLNKKNSTLKNFVFKKISKIEIPKSSKLHRYVHKLRKLYHAPYKFNKKRHPKIINVNKIAIPKKAYLLSFFSRHCHKIMKLKCKAHRFLSLFSCNCVSHMSIQGTCKGGSRNFWKGGLCTIDVTFITNNVEGEWRPCSSGAIAYVTATRRLLARSLKRVQSHAPPSPRKCVSDFSLWNAISSIPETWKALWRHVVKSGVYFISQPETQK